MLLNRHTLGKLNRHKNRTKHYFLLLLLLNNSFKTWATMVLNPWKPVVFVCVCRKCSVFFSLCRLFVLFPIKSREINEKKNLWYFLWLVLSCIFFCDIYFFFGWFGLETAMVAFFSEISFFVVDSHSIVTSRNKQDKNWSKDIERKKIVRFELFKTHTNGLWPTSKTDRHTLKT